MGSFSIKFDGGDVIVEIGQTIIYAHWTSWAILLAITFTLLAAILTVLVILTSRRHDNRS